MPEEFSSRTKEELLREIELKINFLTDEPYNNKRKTVCLKMGVTNENLDGYLKGSKSVTHQKLASMLSNLNSSYADVFKQAELLPADLKPYGNNEVSMKVEETSIYDSLSLEVKALKEMFLDFLSRTEGKEIEQLREQFQRKKEEISRQSDH